MTDDLEEATRRNRAFVKAQREALGADEPERGVCRQKLLISSMSERPGDEVIRLNVERVKKQLRKHVQDKENAIVDTVDVLKLINGDLEVIAIFTRRRVKH